MYFSFGVNFAFIEQSALLTRANWVFCGLIIEIEWTKLWSIETKKNGVHLLVETDGSYRLGANVAEGLVAFSP